MGLAAPAFGPDLAALISEMEAFEASESVEKTGTGSRREGEGFERLVGQMWVAFRRTAEKGGARVSATEPVGQRHYAKLAVESRALIVPATSEDTRALGVAGPSRWLETTFPVAGLIASYPGEAEAIARYSPDRGPFSNQDYPAMYSGLKTKFDDTLVLQDGGVLKEKILLEYKTAKSSRGTQIDGNAHERLSFQVMQYLEVATRYTKCSFVVLANGAFIRYRNKYHVNFHVQADRLANFSWFSMQHACSTTEYSRFLTSLLKWLFEGQVRQTEV